MKCLQELLPYPCRRRGSSNGTSDCKRVDKPGALPTMEQQQQEEEAPSRPLRFSRTRRRKSTAAQLQAERLTKHFFESVDTTNNSSTMFEREEADDTGNDGKRINLNVGLGNTRKKEIKKLAPRCSYASNHVMVNQERRKRNIPLLTRCSILDEMARGKAREMAQKGHVLLAYHSATMVENVHRTPSLQLMHQLVMHGIKNNDRQHILDPRFVKFGMGTAKGTDGSIYVSQLFQGMPSDTDDSDTADVPIKNPRTRVLPTIEIPVDPALLLHNTNKSRRNSDTSQQTPQDNQSHNRASHRRLSVRQD